MSLNLERFESQFERVSKYLVNIVPRLKGRESLGKMEFIRIREGLFINVVSEKKNFTVF